MQGSNDAETCLDGKVRKRKRTAASMGNQSALSIAQISEPTYARASDEKLMMELNSRCRNLCLKRVFSSKEGKIDWNALFEYIREGREFTMHQRRSEILFRLFKGTVINQPAEGTAVKKFKHDWCIPARESYPNLSCINCRSCWGVYYGFSKHSMEMCSITLRKIFSCTGAVVQSYSDSTMMDYTYDQTEEILRTNLAPEENSENQNLIGKYFSSSDLPLLS